MNIDRLFASGVLVRTKPRTPRWSWTDFSKTPAGRRPFLWLILSAVMIILMFWLAARAMELATVTGVPLA